MRHVSYGAWPIRPAHAPVMGKVIPINEQSATYLSPRHSLQISADGRARRLTLDHLIRRIAFTTPLTPLAAVCILSPAIPAESSQTTKSAKQSKSLLREMRRID